MYLNGKRINPLPTQLTAFKQLRIIKALSAYLFTVRRIRRKGSGWIEGTACAEGGNAWAIHNRKSCDSALSGKKFRYFQKHCA